GIVNVEAGSAAGARKCGKVNGVQLNAKLGIAEENHLLPLDLAEIVVLDDHNFDGQLVLDRGDEVSHQHAEAAVAHERDHLPLRVSELSGDGVRQTGRHGREIAAEGVL